MFYPNDPPVADGDPIVIDVGDVWGPGDVEPRRGTNVVCGERRARAPSRLRPVGPMVRLSVRSSRSGTAVRIGIDPATSGAPGGSFPSPDVGGSPSVVATRLPKSRSRFELDAATPPLRCRAACARFPDLEPSARRDVVIA